MKTTLIVSFALISALNCLTVANAGVIERGLGRVMVSISVRNASVLYSGRSASERYADKAVEEACKGKYAHSYRVLNKKFEVERTPMNYVTRTGIVHTHLYADFECRDANNVRIDMEGEEVVATNGAYGD